MLGKMREGVDVISQKINWLFKDKRFCSATGIITVLQVLQTRFFPPQELSCKISARSNEKQLRFRIYSILQHCSAAGSLFLSFGSKLLGLTSVCRSVRSREFSLAQPLASVGEDHTDDHHQHRIASKYLRCCCWNRQVPTKRIIKLARIYRVSKKLKNSFFSCLFEHQIKFKYKQ